MVKLQPGDIILVHQKGFNLLRLVTGLYWNHVILVEEDCGNGRDYETLESIAKGTAPTLLSDYYGQEVAIYRYKGITKDQQKKVIYEARKMGGYGYDFMIFFKVFKRTGIRKGIKLIIDLLNKNYPLEIPHVSDKHVVCSEYVQEAYGKAGIPLETHGWLLTPDAIAMCDCLDEVYHDTL